ncbi:MAG: hypothetical protein IT373_06990 [Polyangiaceae bacterium]|nr:hypothetical protein [Polyangiaceae bacterium]
MRSRALALALALLGPVAAAACAQPGAVATPGAPATAIVTLAAPTAPVASASAPAPEPEPAPARSPRCRIEPEPAEPAEPPPDLCRKVDPPTELALTRAVTPDFEPTRPGAKLGVSFACDPLGEASELVLEEGSGHGFSLRLWRLRRSEDGKRFDVRAVAFTEDPRLRGPKPPAPFELAAGSVEAAAVEGPLRLVRAALLATLRQIDPPPTGAGLGISGTSTSSDFHLLLEVRDRAGRRLAGRYTGYAGTGGQLSYLALRAATARLAPVLDRFAFAAREPDGEDRAFFAARFRATAPRFDDDFSWWVMERYVALARGLGSPALVGGLLGRMRPDATDRSSVDARADALEALARITGWDARRGPGGAIVADPDAARAYLAECAPAPGP